MQKKLNYNYKELPVENLFINPDNARYIYSSELPDEVSSIKELLNLLESQIIALGKDISRDGLNPNELLIVTPLLDDKDKYVVLDGNRRITSIKLMTKYKNQLESLGLSKKVINSFSNFSTTINKVFCVVYDEESIADPLLEKIHTSKPGVGQVLWDPQAQDKHKAKLGNITHRHAIIELLKFSSYTSSDTIDKIKKSGWYSKLDRYAKNTYMRFFGIGFDENDNIQLYLEESEIIKGLSQLVEDLQSSSATEIAQTESVRKKYLYNDFPKDKIPDPTKRNDKIVIFNVSEKIIMVCENICESVDTKTTVRESDDTKTTVRESDYIENIETTVEINCGGKKTNNDNVQSEYSIQDDNGNDSSNVQNSTGAIPPNNNAKKVKQLNLIPEDSYFHIKDTRTRELFEELKKLSVYWYKNTVAISFRSLIEFSVDCYLIERPGKVASLPDNSNITLMYKIEKVYSQLESIYNRDTLKNLMPAIQIDIQNYRDKKNVDTIKILNLCVHHTNYYPDSEQLKALYRNVEPFLKLIWENIK